MKKIRWTILLRLYSMAFFAQALFMLLCIPFSLYYGGSDFNSLFQSLSICLILGVSFYFFINIKNRKRNIENITNIRKKEAYLAVVGIWFILVLSGSMPFYIHGTIPNFADALFESVSGYTTTGSSILTDVESFPKGLATWRSITQWIGGMGILLIVVAILPFLGIGGMSLLSVETTLGSKDKLHPRLMVVAKRIMLVYIILTIVLVILLMLGGVNFFESVNHTFGAIASGGLSVKNNSIVGYSPYVQYVIGIFMFLAATNFTIIYSVSKGNFAKLRDEEFKAFLIIIFIATAISALIMYFHKTNGYDIEEIIRHSFFQVMSIISTTGYSTSDYMTWHPAGYVLMFLLLFIGGMSCSTAGGIKIFRHVLIFKNAKTQILQFAHPNAVLPIRFNGVAVPPNIISNILAVFFIYVITFLVGSFIFAADGNELTESLSISMTCISNVGPGIGSVGPSGNFSGLSDFAKYVCSFLMFAGRLELVTVYTLFVSLFWKN